MMARLTSISTCRFGSHQEAVRCARALVREVGCRVTRVAKTRNTKQSEDKPSSLGKLARVLGRFRKLGSARNIYESISGPREVTMTLKSSSRTVSDMRGPSKTNEKDVQQHALYCESHANASFEPGFMVWTSKADRTGYHRRAGAPR